MAKSFDLLLKWDGAELRPAAQVDRWSLKNMAPDTILECRVWRPRSDRAMRYLHVMLNLAEENSFGWTAEGIKQQVKLRHGWVKGAVVRIDNSVYCETKSLSDFTADELGKFIDQTREFILAEVCPGMDPRLLQRETEDQTKERRR